MPMMQARGGRWSAINKNLEQLLRYLMQMNLMKKRHGYQMTQIGERRAGYEKLEESRAKNQYNLLMQRLANDVSKMPRIDYWRQRIQQKELAGEDAGALLNQAQKEVQEIVGTMFEVGSGQKITEPNLQKSIGFISESLLGKIIPQAAMTERARAERKLGREELEVRKGELGIKERALGVRKEELELKKKIPQEKYYRLIHDKKIAPLQSFLNKFVKVTDKPQDIQMLEGLIQALGKPELIPQAEEVLEGSITPQNLLKLKQKVDQIDTQAMKRKLNDKEYAWLSKVYDLFAMQKEFETVPGVTPFAEAPGVTPFAEAEPAITPEVLPPALPHAPPAPADRTEIKIQALIQKLIARGVPADEAERMAREALGGAVVQ